MRLYVVRVRAVEMREAAEEEMRLHKFPALKNRVARHLHRFIVHQVEVLADLTNTIVATETQVQHAVVVQRTRPHLRQLLTVLRRHRRVVGHPNRAVEVVVVVPAAADRKSNYHLKALTL